jgi:hypothetical protein
LAPVLTIRRRADLALLLARPTPRRILLDLPGKPAAQTAYWQNRMARRLGACGCTTASMFLLAGLVPGAAMLWPDIGALPRWGLALAMVAGFAATGKVIGLTLARRKLRAEIKSLASWIAAPA